MKTFRGKEVIGWKLVSQADIADFENEVNELMEKYNFEDFLFAVDRFRCYATIFLSKKEL